jgi:hypothetical protein
MTVRRRPELTAGPHDIGEILRGYAERGVFRSLGASERRGGRIAFTIVWHHGRPFRFVVDPRARIVSFPELLPPMSGRPAMLKELRAFLRRFESPAVPAHRRIDPAKGRLRIAARRNGVSVAIAVKRGQWEYCTRKLVHLAHEIYMVFLPDGPYQDYLVEKLGLDPDVIYA